VKPAPPPRWSPECVQQQERVVQATLVCTPSVVTPARGGAGGNGSSCSGSGSACSGANASMGGLVPQPERSGQRSSVGRVAAALWAQVASAEEQAEQLAEQLRRSDEDAARIEQAIWARDRELEELEAARFKAHGVGGLRSLGASGPKACISGAAPPHGGTEGQVIGIHSQEDAEHVAARRRAHCNGGADGASSDVQTGLSTGGDAPNSSCDAQKPLNPTIKLLEATLARARRLTAQLVDAHGEIPVAAPCLDESL